MSDDTPSLLARILVPLDGSTLAAQALPYAQAVASRDADLLLLRVEPVPESFALVGGEVYATADQLRDAAQSQAERELAPSVATLRAAGFRADAVVAFGAPADGILRVAAEARRGLIVLASHGRGAAGRVVFGSVADRVAHASPVPVLIVRAAEEAPAAAAAPAPIARLVVPLDGSDLARSALPVASEVAARLVVPVRLVQAILARAELELAGTGLPVPREVYAELEQRAEEDARRGLEAAAATLRAAGVEATTEVWRGPAAAVIAGACRAGDVIVMSSHGRSGVGRWLLGSVAEQLVRTTPVPVLLVPAPDRRRLTAALAAAPAPAAG